MFLPDDAVRVVVRVDFAGAVECVCVCPLHERKLLLHHLREGQWVQRHLDLRKGVWWSRSVHGCSAGTHSSEEVPQPV